MVQLLVNQLFCRGLGAHVTCSLILWTKQMLLLRQDWCVNWSVFAKDALNYCFLSVLLDISMELASLVRNTATGPQKTTKDCYQQGKGDVSVFWSEQGRSIIPHLKNHLTALPVAAVLGYILSARWRTKSPKAVLLTLPDTSGSILFQSQGICTSNSSWWPPVQAVGYLSPLHFFFQLIWILFDGKPTYWQSGLRAHNADRCLHLKYTQPRMSTASLTLVEQNSSDHSILCLAQEH